MKILITGGNGYIGKSLYNSLKDKYDVISISRNDFDLTAFEAMNKFFQGKYFDVIIHCAVVGGSRLKTDSYKDMDINLTMYYNLLQHKPHFNKLIYFGSGAEIHNPKSPYGLSKKVISNSVSEIDNFYNLQIYAVFDENELDTRFIKNNIKNYINKKPIDIHKDKKMDFFYMKDLVKLVEHYINNNNLPKKVDCSYEQSLSLLDIINIINTLDVHVSPINFHSQVNDKSYKGKFNNLGIKYIGLKQGIKEVYNKLKDEH
jgi:nucleoside-diphosphate-sugar epimerase